MFRSSRLRIALGMVAIGAILLATAVIRRADAGGVRCMLNSLELQLERPEFADELRDKGPEGLSEALVLYDTALRFKADLEVGAASDPNYASGGFTPEATEVCERAKQLVDRVAGQRDAWMSRLYWYTDLEQAKAAAAESGKPILSLRMLGKLCDEYSCANSRFFRTALYANESVSQKLRDDFVLHWQSVRPVPRVTIDFGDGRKLERTLTGNSAHFLLDATGRPLDVLPGLYGPQAFRQWLGDSLVSAYRWAEWRNDPMLAEVQLMRFHAQKWQAVEQNLRADLAAISPELLTRGDAPVKASFVSKDQQPAVAAGVRAFTKGRVEAPLLAAALPATGLPAAAVLESHAPGFWAQVGAAHAEVAELDAASITLMRPENSMAFAAGALSATKRAVEDPMLRLVRTFQESLSVDTMRNEYTLHQTVRRWFAEGLCGVDAEALNERVYAELFLTPASDPWLGLAPAEAYTALDEGGLTAGTEPVGD
jgi:hypothetical protein